MIRLFERDETNFNHNETPLPDVISAIVELESNGMYELVLEYPRNDFAKTLTAGKVLKADTPKGEQLFRIYKPIKNLKTYTIYARHVFYDLAKNFIENVRPTNTTGNSAIQTILSGVAVEHGFSGSSDIAGLNTANYVRMSPIQALLGADNAFLKVWGGELTRDNFTFRIDAQGGQDRGYEIRLGKNLIGIEADVDETNVYTCVYPTVVIDGNTVTTLPEKYIYSPLVDNYESTYVIEERIELSDEEKELPLEAIYTLMRERVALLFEQGVDKPEVNYKVDFVELSKTEQYKHLQILEQLNLYDTVDVIVDELDIRVNAKVIKYAYDSLRKRFVSMELGNFKQNLASQTKNTLGMVEKQINQSANLIREAFERSNDLITGNRGGHVVMRRNAEGLPYEILIMDTDDIQTAQNVIRMNQQGIGFSETGYNGPFGVAITIDGNLNAEVMNVFNIKADNIVGNTTEFVRSAWNSVNGWTYLDGDGITMTGSGSWRKNILSDWGVELYNDAGASNLAGLIGYFSSTSEPNWSRPNPAFQSSFQRHFVGIAAAEWHKVGLGYSDDPNDSEVFKLVFEIDPRTTPKARFLESVDMFRNNIERVGTMKVDHGTTGQRFEVGAWDFQMTYHGHNGHNFLAQGDSVLRLNHKGNGYAHLGLHLNMDGNEIYNQSDIRLKENIESTSISGIEETKRIEMVDYYWKKDHPVTQKYSKEKQFGLIAQSTPFLSDQSYINDGSHYLSVNRTKQIDLNTLTNQELIARIEEIEERLEKLEV